MAVRSVYLVDPSIQNDRIHITGDEHRHLMVARAQSSEVVEIFDGKGSVWTATIESAGKHEMVAQVTGFCRMPGDPLQLVLALALIRTAAFELALEKVAEVGITRIVPFMAERSNVSAGNRHERWLRILVEAAKQSKQYYLPVLDSPASFEQVLLIPATSKILFAERDGRPLKSALAGSPALYLVGPEGGWTDRELSAARDSGFHEVLLGRSILKAETAAIVGAALIRYELGK
jgi:16S rRNA (uracil1498-N3)-methyltransferase